jgi:hypothetical protein
MSYIDPKWSTFMKTTPTSQLGEKNLGVLPAKRVIGRMSSSGCMLQAHFAIVWYSTLIRSRGRMWEVMNAYMCNMIIGSENAAPVIGDHPYDEQVYHAKFVHQVSSEFADFLVLHAEFHEKATHGQPQEDLVKHLKVLK